MNNKHRLRLFFREETIGALVAVDHWLESFEDAIELAKEKVEAEFFHIFDYDDSLKFDSHAVTNPETYA